MTWHDVPVPLRFLSTPNFFIGPPLRRLVTGRDLANKRVTAGMMNANESAQFDLGQCGLLKGQHGDHGENSMMVKF